MREQVPDGRSRRPGGLVEVDEPFFGRDEHGDRGRDLRHGCPREPKRALAVRCLDRAGDSNRRVGARPSVDLAQRVHERRD
jgi:hypothetical protein